MIGTESFRNSSPKNRILRPITNSAHDLNLLFGDNIKGRLKAIKGRVIIEILNPFSNPTRAMIHAVIVVPILAPMIIPADSFSDKRPALTRLTTITVNADEDWIPAVILNPVKMLLNLLEVIDERIFRNRLPDTFCRASLISFMPKRKTPRDPTIVSSCQITFTAFRKSNLLG